MLGCVLDRRPTSRLELPDRAEARARRARVEVARRADLSAARRAAIGLGPWSPFCSRIPPLRTALRAPREQSMTFVVTEACIKCKYTDCVEVCPVDCFHEGPNMLVDRSRGVHRLHALRARVPGRSDLLRRRRAGRSGAVHEAQRGALEELARHHEGESRAARRRRLERRQGQAQAPGALERALTPGS